MIDYKELTDRISKEAFKYLGIPDDPRKATAEQFKKILLYKIMIDACLRGAISGIEYNDIRMVLQTVIKTLEVAEEEMKKNVDSIRNN